MNHHHSSSPPTTLLLLNAQQLAVAGNGAYCLFCWFAFLMHHKSAINNLNLREASKSSASSSLHLSFLNHSFSLDSCTASACWCNHHHFYLVPSRVCVLLSLFSIIKTHDASLHASCIIARAHSSSPPVCCLLTQHHAWRLITFYPSSACCWCIAASSGGTPSFHQAAYSKSMIIDQQWTKMWCIPSIILPCSRITCPYMDMMDSFWVCWRVLVLSSPAPPEDCLLIFYTSASSWILHP